MGSYTEKSEEALTKMLRDIPLWGYDSADSDALTKAARKAQESVTWRKVAPYFAESFIYSFSADFSADNEVPVSDVVLYALFLWIEAQPVVLRVFAKDYDSAHVGVA